MKSVIVCLFALTATVGLATASEDKPYKGQHKRNIASLSESDVSALLQGQGWGFAKAAELNGYPGPRHVLELAEELKLSVRQRADITTVFETMQADARALGADMVAAERALDRRFKMGSLEQPDLIALTQAIADVRAKLRTVHLVAHLATAPLLTDHQRRQYQLLRGYGDSHGAGHGNH